MWDKKLDIEEAYKQLDNPNNYQKLKKTTLSLDKREISKTARELISTDALPMPARLLIKHHSKLRFTNSTILVDPLCQHAAVPLNTSLNTLMLCLMVHGCYTH